MLDNIITIYNDMPDMMKRVKKKKYEANMNYFRETYGHFFTEMMELMDASEDQEKTAREIADTVIAATKEKFTKWGRIRGYVQVNVNFFAIYYIFPAILMEAGGQKPVRTAASENAPEGAEGSQPEKVKKKTGVMVADTLRDQWNASFADTHIQYADYQTIHDAFNEKIFGMF
ncbi:MAG: hypothetical protein K6G83_14630 [Lachnospiraceae bacterium]|nr:hypothetical protein [Lachnospiraceae bacterium]